MDVDWFSLCMRAFVHRSSRMTRCVSYARKEVRTCSVYAE